MNVVRRLLVVPTALCLILCGTGPAPKAPEPTRPNIQAVIDACASQRDCVAAVDRCYTDSACAIRVVVDHVCMCDEKCARERLGL